MGGLFPQYSYNQTCLQRMRWVCGGGNSTGPAVQRPLYSPALLPGPANICSPNMHVYGKVLPVEVPNHYLQHPLLLSTEMVVRVRGLAPVASSSGSLPSISNFCLIFSRQSVYINLVLRPARRT